MYRLHRQVHPRSAQHRVLLQFVLSPPNEPRPRPRALLHRRRRRLQPGKRSLLLPLPHVLSPPSLPYLLQRQRLLQQQTQLLLQRLLLTLLRPQTLEILVLALSLRLSLV